MTLSLPQTAASLLIAFMLGSSLTLAFLFLAKLAQAGHDTGETVDDILDTAGRDLPTQRLHQPRPGTVYSSRHRRTGEGERVARVGRTNGWRHRPASRRLP